MAIDTKNLPEDLKRSQQMVLDLMAQLDREFTERGKIETLLRELLDARRNRKSEQLSADQLDLFAVARQARQAATEASESEAGSDDDDAKSGVGQADRKKKTGRRSLPRHLKRERILRDLPDAEKHCDTCQQDLRPIGGRTAECCAASWLLASAFTPIRSPGSKISSLASPAAQSTASPSCCLIIGLPLRFKTPTGIPTSKPYSVPVVLRRLHITA